MSDQHPPPYGDGSHQPPYQPPQGGGGYPPPSPPTSGGGFPPPTSGAGGYPPPTSGAGGGFPPPTSGGGFSPPGAGQPGYGPPGQPGFDPNQPPPFDPNAPQPGFGQPGFDPNQQQPFGAAPGAPLPPMTPGQGRGGGKMKIILAVVGALLLLCCIGGAAVAVTQFDVFGGGAADAKVGDCLKGKAIDRSSDRFRKADLKVVKCSEGNARYKVVGRVENKTQAQADEAVCREFTGAELIYWEGPDGEEGTVLCLQTNQ